MDTQNGAAAFFITGNKTTATTKRVPTDRPRRLLLLLTFLAA